MEKGLAYLGAGLAIGVGGFGAAIGIGMLVAKTQEAMARQPEAGGMLRTAMFIGLAFAEAIALYALVIAFILSGK
jgi:F-type H+-transporting ATPase subunit c